MLRTSGSWMAFCLPIVSQAWTMHIECNSVTHRGSDVCDCCAFCITCTDNEFSRGKYYRSFFCTSCLGFVLWFVTYVLVEWNCSTSWENCRKQLNGDFTVLYLLMSFAMQQFKSISHKVWFCVTDVYCVALYAFAVYAVIILSVLPSH